MIKAEGIVKTFNEFTALDHLNCEIPKGCIYGMIGSNGAGKSTFLRMLSGVYRADKGTLTLDGEPIYENPAAKAKIAYVPDELYFLQGATMNRMAKLFNNVFPFFDMKRYRELTKLFNLDPQKKIHSFSKGMKRQAAIILFLSLKTEYIFFDETFDGLDPVMRNLVKKIFINDVLERNATIIITSHSLRELEDTCDQLALLHKGGIIFQSDVENMKTSLFKVQIAFSESYERERFDGMDIVKFVKSGSVSNFIVRGEKEATMERLKTMAPSLLDILPLSLEEVFIYEMESLGYTFDDILLEATDE